MPANRNVGPAKRPNTIRDLCVIILAAGESKKMKSLGVRSLINIKSRQTVIQKQLDTIWAAFPNCEIVVVSGFESDRLAKRLPDNVRIVENERFAETNVVRSMSLGLRATVCKNVIFVYGDLVFNVDALDGLCKNGSAAVVDSKKQFDDNEVGVGIESGLISHFSFGLPTKWGQIIFLTGNELRMTKDIVYNRENKNLCGHEVFERLVQSDEVRIRAVENERMKLAEIDQAKDIARASTI